MTPPAPKMPPRPPRNNQPQVAWNAPKFAPAPAPRVSQTPHGPAVGSSRTPATPAKMNATPTATNATPMTVKTALMPILFILIANVLIIGSLFFIFTIVLSPVGIAALIQAGKIGLKGVKLLFQKA